MTRSTRPTWWRGIAALIALLLVLAACGNDDNGDDDNGDDTTPTTEDAGGDPGEDDEVPEPQYGGRVVMALEAEAGGYIPGLTATGTSSPSVDPAIYDPMVVINAEGEFEPYLAASFEPNEALDEWTFTLRSGIEFHDGTPLNAEAVVWNYENLHLDPDSLTAGAMTTAGLIGVEAVDELTVVYQLDGANAAFPDLLTGRVGLVASPTAFEEMGMDAFGDAPVGTGPFMVENWVRDDRIVLSRNPNYWQEDQFGNQLPYLDEIEFRPIPDEDSRISTLQSDGAQIMQTTRGYAGVRVAELAEDDDGFSVNVSQGNIQGASLFNTAVPPLDDVRVRTAMVLAASSDDVAAAQGYGELTEASSQFVSSDSPWYSSTAAAAFPGFTDGPDPDEAAALLQEYLDDPERSDNRGVGEPLAPIRYQCPPEASLQDMTVTLQNAWSGIGIELELSAPDQPALIGNVIGGPDDGFIGDYDMSCWRVGTNDDPLNYVSNYFGPVESTVTNFVNYTDPEITEQLEILRTSPDFEERYAALERINTLNNEAVTTAWHIAYASTVGWRSDVQNVSTWWTPEGSPGRSNLAGTVWTHYLWLDQ